LILGEKFHANLSNFDGIDVFGYTGLCREE
jgi:hypothetical protein